MKKVLYILSLLTIFSCSKSENIVDQIPSKSIAKCKINGVLWEGELKSCGILNNTFVASASKKTSNGTDELLIGIDDVNSTSSFKFEDAFQRNFALYNTTTLTSITIGKDVEMTRGILTITKTKTIGNVIHANAIFSGTAADDNDKIVQITDGVIINLLVQ